MISRKTIRWEAYILLFTSVTCKSLSSTLGTEKVELFGNISDVEMDKIKSTVNDNPCDLESTTVHGSFDNIISQSVTCPRDGIVDEITYWSKLHEEGPRVHAISFKCNSSLGITYEGPFGTQSGKERVLKCKNSNEHIKYIHGRAGHYISKLEIVCSKKSVLYDNDEINEEYLQNANEDEQIMHNIDTNRENRRITPIENFNDECYSTKGRRPVTFEVWADKFVQGLRTTYKSVPVSKDCKISHIQFLEKDKGLFVTNLVVLGFTSGFTCSTSQQQISLDVTDSISNSKEKEKQHHSDKTLTGTVPQLTYNMGGVLFAVGTLEITSGVKVIRPISLKSNSSSNLAESVYQNILGTTINYDGPGMALVVGYKISYYIDNIKIPVLYHYSCAGGGSRTYDEGTIDLHKSKLETIFFLDYHYKFNNREDCLKSSYPQECVASILVKNFITNPDQLEKEFYKCFDTEEIKIPFQK